MSIRFGGQPGSILLFLFAAIFATGSAEADPESDYAEGLKAFLAEDLINAMHRLEQASQAGHTKAQVLYAYILNKAEENESAMRYYRMAADAGDPDAMAAIGTMYASGDGVERNEAEAVNWYEKAAALGHNGALETLGAAYMDGQLGVEKNTERGRELLQKAAGNGHESARRRLDSYNEASAN